MRLPAIAAAWMLAALLPLGASEAGPGTLEYLRVRPSASVVLGTVRDGKALLEVTVALPNGSQRVIAPKDRVERLGAATEASVAQHLSRAEAFASAGLYREAFDELATAKTIADAIGTTLPPSASATIAASLEALAVRFEAVPRTSELERDFAREELVSALYESIQLGANVRGTGRAPLDSAIRELQSELKTLPHEKRSWKAAAVLVPEDYGTLIMADGLKIRGRVRDALFLARRYNGANATNQDGQRLFVELLERAGRHQEGFRILRGGPEQWPGATKEAAKLLTRLLESNPWPYELKAEPREVFELLTRFDSEADRLLMLVAATRFNGRDGGAHYELALLREERGSPEKAVFHFKMALAGEGAPDDTARRIECLELCLSRQEIENAVASDVAYYREIVFRSVPLDNPYVVTFEAGIGPFSMSTSTLVTHISVPEVRDPARAHAFEMLLRKAPVVRCASDLTTDEKETIEDYLDGLRNREANYDRGRQ